MLFGNKEGEKLRRVKKFRRSARAISPIISALLLIAIAVMAAIVTYAWVMGYIGDNTSKFEKSIDIVSYTSETNLMIYVQNTGQGTVHLKQDSSVYVNGVLKNIFKHDDIPVDGSLIPIQEGLTVKIEVAYRNFQPSDSLKVVSVEGIFMTR
jgi:flagellin-like protein